MQPDVARPIFGDPKAARTAGARATLDHHSAFAAYSILKWRRLRPVWGEGTICVSLDGRENSAERFRTEPEFLGFEDAFLRRAPQAINARAERIGLAAQCLVGGTPETVARTETSLQYSYKPFQVSYNIGYTLGLRARCLFQPV